MYVAAEVVVSDFNFATVFLLQLLSQSLHDGGIFMFSPGPRDQALSATCPYGDLQPAEVACCSCQQLALEQRSASCAWPLLITCPMLLQWEIFRASLGIRFRLHASGGIRTNPMMAGPPTSSPIFSVCASPHAAVQSQAWLPPEELGSLGMRYDSSRACRSGLSVAYNAKH